MDRKREREREREREERVKRKENYMVFIRSFYYEDQLYSRLSSDIFMSEKVRDVAFKKKNSILKKISYMASIHQYRHACITFGHFIYYYIYIEECFTCTNSFVSYDYETYVSWGLYVHTVG